MYFVLKKTLFLQTVQSHGDEEGKEIKYTENFIWGDNDDDYYQTLNK